MALGERLRKLRRMLRLSQEELAYRLGTNRVSISQWENNRVSPDTDSLTKIAAVLGTSIAYLLGETDDPASYRYADADIGCRLASAVYDDDNDSAGVVSEPVFEESMLLNLFRGLDDAGKAEVINFIQYKLHCLQKVRKPS
ncbi:MAG: helix-turn-helix transcriptional regulator [Synergistaceae bacterium]|nr:helix-turn-helix transcriptional regulator [Synergistaceae bacterium]